MDASEARKQLPARVFSFYGRSLGTVVRTKGDRWNTKSHITVVTTTTRDVWEYGTKRQWNRISSTPRVKRKKL